jgi:hypothetical protein
MNVCGMAVAHLLKRARLSQRRGRKEGLQERVQALSNSAEELGNLVRILVASV